jgi:hypothetical protein
MDMRSPLSKAALFSLLALTIGTGDAHAQERYQRTQDLTFGRFAITNNSAQHDLTIDPNGNVTADPAYVLTAPPTYSGAIILDQLLSSVPMSVTFTDGTMSVNGSGIPPLFLVTDFTTNGPFVTTPAGTLNVLFGATLRSSGTGDVYENGPYTGSFDITFDY